VTARYYYVHDVENEPALAERYADARRQGGMLTYRDWLAQHVRMYRAADHVHAVHMWATSAEENGEDFSEADAVVEVYDADGNSCGRYTCVPTRSWDVLPVDEA